MWKINFMNMSKSGGKIFHLYVPSLVALFILSTASVVMTNYLTPHQVSSRNIEEILMNMFYMLGLIYGEGVMNTFYIENCFDNTSIQIRPVLRIFGMKARNYWIGQFIADYSLFLLTVPPFVSYLYFFNIVALLSKFTLVLLIFVTFGASMITSFYVYGVLFQKRSRNCYFVFFTILAIYTPVGLYFSSMAHHCQYWSLINAGFSIFPMVQLMQSNAQIILQYYKIPNFCDGVLEPEYVPIFYTVQAFLYLVLAMFLEFKKFEHRILTPNKEASSLQIQIEDEQFNVDRVLEQRNKVDAEYGTSHQANMQARHIMIKYKSQPLPAVADVSFQVKQSEILGLLGPNGAGKTSTFQAFLQNEPLKLGQARVLDSEISENLNSVETGLCAQNDILWERLNVLEHLQIYSDIKGLSDQMKNQQIWYLTRSLNLSEYMLIASQNLSGGNKRKLCVAISMLGSPKLNFHDQPTTGVDPVSRRNLWMLFKHTSRIKQRSLLLTTQKMDEAEILCDRMAIMVNGQIRYLGTPNQLRDELTKGYYITVKKAKEENDFVQYFAQQGIAEMKVEIDNEKEAILSIARENLKLAKVLHVLNTMKESRVIEDWILTRSNLDEVFMRVARQQRIATT